MLERAKKILMVLELTEWRWTINDVLEQPEQELDAVIGMKALGEKMRKQARDRKSSTSDVEKI